MKQGQTILNLLLIPVFIFSFVRLTLSAPQGPAMVWLLSAGPSQAKVKYESQVITVTKCFACAKEQGVKIGLYSIDMGLLQPCIGKPIMAVVDNGEILSLRCGERTPAVLVIPDAF